MTAKEKICENCGHGRNGHIDKWGGICVGCPCPGFEPQDAAGSLPAQPKFQKVFCSQCGGEFGPRDAGYSHCEDHQEPGNERDSYLIEEGLRAYREGDAMLCGKSETAGWICKRKLAHSGPCAAEPIAPVEAKDMCGANLGMYECRLDYGHPNDHDDQGVKWLNSFNVAEPKPTPSTPENEFIYIDPRTKEPCRRCDGKGFMPPWPGSNGLVSCGVCRAEERPKSPNNRTEGTWPSACVQRAFVEGMKWWQWQRHRATAFRSEVDEAESEAVKRYGVPHPASISSEQTFEEWWFDYDESEHELPSRYEAAKAAWAAAKGSTETEGR